MKYAPYITLLLAFSACHKTTTSPAKKIKVEYSASCSSLQPFNAVFTDSTGEPRVVRVTTGGYVYSWSGSIPHDKIIMLGVDDSIALTNPKSVLTIIKIDGEEVAYREGLSWGLIYHKF